MQISQSPSRFFLAQSKTVGQNSVLYTLNKSKRSSLKPKNFLFSEDELKTTNNRQLRRKSCYCSECGQLSQFQYRNLNNNVSLKPVYPCKKINLISKSMKLNFGSRRQSMLIQRHSRMNTCNEAQIQQVYNLSPSKASPIKQPSKHNKLRLYFQNELKEQIRKNAQNSKNYLSLPLTYRDSLDTQTTSKALVKNLTTIHRNKPDIRPYLSHLKLKPIKQQTSTFEI